MKKTDRYTIGIIAVWGLINLLQSYFTELSNDEAYYWIFGLRPDWGYFNHPPAIGLMIYLGEWLFDGEIAVRISTILMNLGGLYLIIKLIKPKDYGLFVALLGGMAIFHVLSFISVPDVPCFFFTCLYFYYLNQYIEKTDLFSAIMIGFSVAMMGYSKYQGILVLFFSLLPLLHLFRKRNTWIAVLVSLLLFLPHLFWQYSRGFPTFRFHLFERMPEAWKWTFPLDFIGGQLLVFGPLISIPIFIAIAQYKVKKNSFEQSLKWTILGSLFFFFLMSFRGRTEANWTSFLILPISYLTYHYFSLHQAYWRSKIYYLGMTTLLLIFIIRIYAIVDFLPDQWEIRNEFHEYDEWALDLKKKANGLPVIFFSSYQPISKYMFYSKENGFLISMDRNSGSQFLMWPEWELSFQHKPVFNLCNGWVHCTDSMDINGKRTPYRIIDNWRSFNYLKISVSNPIESIDQNGQAQMKLELFNPTDEKITLTGTQGEPLLLYSAVYRHNEPISTHQTPLKISSLEPGEKVLLDGVIRAPNESGAFKYTFAIEVPDVFSGKNCRFYPIEVQ